MNLRDLIGAERAPPLRTTGSIESVTVWIIEVQCALLKATGLDVSPFDLGLPANFGAEEEENLMNHAKSQPRPPMADLANTGLDANQAAYEASMQAAQATRLRNQQGSNIFG